MPPFKRGWTHRLQARCTMQVAIIPLPIAAHPHTSLRLLDVVDADIALAVVLVVLSLLGAALYVAHRTK
jgi:hypothetical protein